MNCLCCGKPFPGPEPASGWHKACITRFFGTGTLPEIILTDAVWTELVEKTVQKGYTVPGVQKKLSLHLSKESKPKLTIIDYPAGYILKPPVEEFRALPESEHLIMQMASIAGLSVVPHALVRMNNRYAYLTKRVDRINTEKDGVRMLAMEDFCQLDQRLTADKYRGSYERCVRVIRQYSAQPGLDLSELFMRLVFCFLTGNSDMHLKNFSLLETSPLSGRYVLSPAYDLLPVNIIMPEDQEEFALTMNRRKAHFHRPDFIAFAEYAGLQTRSAERMMDRISGFVPEWIRMCEESLMPEDMKADLIQLMKDRRDRLDKPVKGAGARRGDGNVR